MKVSKSFDSKELTAPELHDIHPTWFISDWQVSVAQFFRDKFGATVVNDYKWGGGVYAEGIIYNNSGTRSPLTDVEGAKFSQHKMMNALDMKFFSATPDEVRDHIMNNRHVFRDIGVTTIESGKIADTWVHVDGRCWNDNEIHIVGE